MKGNMKFNLVKKSSNQLVVKYHVTNSDGDICGSINVSPSEEADLLRCWVGSTAKPQQSRMSSQRNPMVAALLNAKSKFINRQALLRSC
jgi:hypothetical protein